MINCYDMWFGESSTSKKKSELEVAELKMLFVGSDQDG